MKLNIYKNQKEIAKTYEIDTYDIMYGTVQDILGLLEDGIDDLKNEDELLKLVVQNREKLDEFLLDMFEDQGLTKEELRMTKIKELIPMFIELFGNVKASFQSKN